MRCPLVKLEFRGNDETGHGYYGAKRGIKKHKGVDLISIPGSSIYCPINGTITKLGQVYKNPTKFKYIEITNEIYRIRLMYTKANSTIKVNQKVSECNVIGIAQDIAGYWGGKMKNHIHMQIWKYGLLTDAEPLLLLGVI